MNKKLLSIIPLLTFIILSMFLYIGLFGNPRELQSGRVGQTMPAFQLPDLMNASKQWRDTELKGEMYLLNVWGIWCPTCISELGFLHELKNRGVRVIGLYYEQGYDPDFGDTFDINTLQLEVTEMLDKTGNPYQFNILDLNRELALDLGVSGAPETFLVDANGVILLHHVGDINQRVWRTKFAPAFQELSL